MSNLTDLEQHRRTINLRTLGSLACYAGFVATSVISALQQLALEDPVTLLAIGLIIAAFLALPRDYVPPVLARRAATDEEQQQLDALRRQQRHGLYIRIAYALGAVITILALPRFVVG